MHRRKFLSGLAAATVTGAWTTARATRPRPRRRSGRLTAPRRGTDRQRRHRELDGVPCPGAAHAARAGDPLDGRPEKAEHLTRWHARLLLLIVVAAVIGIRAVKRSQTPTAAPATSTARPARQEPSAAPRP